MTFKHRNVGDGGGWCPFRHQIDGISHSLSSLIPFQRSIARNANLRSAMDMAKSGLEVVEGIWHGNWMVCLKNTIKVWCYDWVTNVGAQGGCLRVQRHLTVYQPKNQMKINEDIVYDLGTVALGYTCAVGTPCWMLGLLGQWWLAHFWP